MATGRFVSADLELVAVVTAHELIFYTVYEKPSDFPDSWVVRRSRVARGKVLTEEAVWCLADSLEDARQSLPPGLHWQAPHPTDDGCIAEVWY